MIYLSVRKHLEGVLMFGTTKKDKKPVDPWKPIGGLCVKDVCKTRNKIVLSDIQRRLDIIADSYNIMMKTKNIDTFYSRCGVFSKHVEGLTEHAENGVKFKPALAEYINTICEDMQRKEIALKERAWYVQNAEANT